MTDFYLINQVIIIEVRNNKFRGIDMSKSDKIEVLKFTIWFNLFIGIYNIYVFNELNSLFHLVLGSVNIGVWVFFREKYLNFSFAKLFGSIK
jgi:hypothetical protein